MIVPHFSVPIGEIFVNFPAEKEKTSKTSASGHRIFWGHGGAYQRKPEVPPFALVETDPPSWILKENRRSYKSKPHLSSGAAGLGAAGKEAACLCTMPQVQGLPKKEHRAAASSSRKKRTGSQALSAPKGARPFQKSMESLTP